MDDDLARLRAEDLDDAVIATIDGEIDLSNAAEMAARLRDVAARRILILDVSALDYIDSSGLAMIDALNRELSARDATLLLVVGEHAIATRVVQLAGFDAVVGVHSTRAQAVAAARAGLAGRS